MKNLICALLISAMPMAQTSESTSEIVESFNIEFDLTFKEQTIYQNHETLQNTYYRKSRILFNEQRDNLLIGGNYYEFAQGITQNNDITTMKAIVGTITGYWILQISNYNNQKIEINELEAEIHMNFYVPQQFLQENTFIIQNDAVLTSNAQWQQYNDLPVMQFNNQKITEMDNLFQNDVYAIQYYQDDNSGYINEVNGNYYLYSGTEKITNYKYLVVKTTFKASQYNEGLPYYEMIQIQNIPMVNARLFINGNFYKTPTTVNVTQEVIDVPNIMFTILTMPFSFISQAFNLTLFPNTPYELSISNLFLAIIGTLIMIMIIRIIVKGSSN